MVEVRRSTVIEAPLADVWRILRDFNSHRHWHPAVADSLIEEGKQADQVGAIRRFHLVDGGELREQLLCLSDARQRLIYCILDAPLPLYGYVATIQLKAITDGDKTFWAWYSTFDPPPVQAEELAALVAERIYEAGFAALKREFAQALTARERELLQAVPPARRNAIATPASSAQSLESRAIVLHRHGGPEELRWEAVSAPPPGPGQVRIRHSAIGVNYIDVYCRSGYFDLLTVPGTPGMEAAGVVIDSGPGVHGLMPGDRVAYACAPVGAYCEVRTLDAAFLVLLPDDIDDEIAAATLLKGMTAEFLLHRVHAVKEGDIVLVQAAAGGVGLLLCQWARHLGATVIGTVGSTDKARLARRYGCAYPIVYTERDFVAEVLEITAGRGVDVVYDAVGRDTFMKSYQALAVRGHLVSYGQAAGDIGPIDIAAFANKSARVSRPNYGHYAGTPETVRALADRLFDAIRRGYLQALIGQRYPLREAAQAHRDLEARRSMGSTVLLP